MEKEGLSQTRTSPLPPQSLLCSPSPLRTQQCPPPDPSSPGRLERRRRGDGGGVLPRPRNSRVPELLILRQGLCWPHHPLVLTPEGLRLPWPSLTSCVATGTCTHPRGGGTPPTWTPWDRPPVSPPTPIHLGTQMSPASATPARRVLMLTLGGWASLTPSAPDRRQPQPTRGWGGLDPRHHVPGTGRGHGV